MLRTYFAYIKPCRPRAKRFKASFLASNMMPVSPRLLEEQGRHTEGWRHGKIYLVQAGSKEEALDALDAAVLPGDKRALPRDPRKVYILQPMPEGWDDE